MDLRSRAQRARALARGVTNPLVAADLHSYALELETQATTLEAATLPPVAMDAPTGEPSTGPEAIAAMKSEPDLEPDKSQG